MKTVLVIICAAWFAFSLFFVLALCRSARRKNFAEDIPEESCAPNAEHKPSDERAAKVRRRSRLHCCPQLVSPLFAE